MHFFYSALTYALRPFAFAVVLWRGIGNRDYWVGLRERFGWVGPRMGAPSLWLHAVSLGEVNAAAPLVRELRARHPQSSLILTTATPTGRTRAKALFGDAITLRFLPYDTPGAMQSFLDGACPRLAIIMETELWPNLYRECRRRGIPLVLANARLSVKSVARYRRLGKLFRGVFQGEVHVAAQSVDDAARFVAIGATANRTSVMGNLKFDVVIDAAVRAQGEALRATRWPGRAVWVAGSTHAGEEEMVIAAHTQIGRGIPRVLLLLAPRHPQRFEAVAQLLASRNIRYQRRSSDDRVRADSEVLLVDSVGELATLYGAADAAFVGGSLVPVGGHNLLEPAALGVPVITGPHQANAREVAAALLGAGGVLQVADAVQLAARIGELLQDPQRRRDLSSRASDVVAANRGSLQRLLTLIESLLAARSRG